MLAGRIGGLRCGGPLFDLAAAESGDVGHLILCPFPWKGDARRAGGAEGEREWSQPPALRATSFQRKEGEVVKKHFLHSHRRGMPEGQGVGRMRKRAKPTSGATRHLLPMEGGSQANESRAFWHCHSLSGAALYFYAPHHAHCIFSACSLIPVFQRSSL